MTIKDLVNKYDGDRENHLSAKYNETLLRSDFLDPLFELLGWDIKNHLGKSTNEREVLLEEALKENATEHSKKPDYTFRLFSERKFFLEAKKPCVSIQSNNDTSKQIRRYGFTAKLKISVISNFEYLMIYDTSVQVESGDNYHKALIKKYYYKEYESKFEEIKSLLGKDSVYSGQFDDEWNDIQLKLDHYSVDNLFLDQINEWRKLLGNEIFKHKPTINEQELNDVVQSYLNRILFLRVCEDRNLEDYQTLLNFANAQDFKSLTKKFGQADTRYNSGLFNQFLSDKIIEDIGSVFWTIIKKLYYPESPYSFAVFSSDILGNIYEIFLSERLAIKNGAIVLEKKPEHADRDIITTPTFIIGDILRQTVIPKCKGKSDKEVLKLAFADIACGSGAFLLETYQLLIDTLIDFYLQNDKSKLVQTNINTYQLPFAIKRQLLLKCIYGVDKDFNAVEATKFGLLLKLLENEDVQSTKTSKPVLPDLSDNICYGNSLLESKDVKKGDRNEINPFSFAEKFDVIVGNPPYMSTEDMKNITPKEFPIYKTKYLSAYKQFDKYFLFIERGLKLLKNDGLLGYIVPNKFTKVGAGKNLRNLLSTGEHLNLLISFGAKQVFSDKTTYTCLLVLQKKPTKTFLFGEVRDLQAWKVRNPNAIQLGSKNIVSLDNEVWVLVPPELLSTYDSINKQSTKLIDLVGKDNIFNGIQTSANDVYVFIPTKEDSKYYYFTKNKIACKIEKDITKPYFQTSSGEDNLYTYRTFKPNARVIFPYEDNNGIKLISLKSIQNKYPLAYKYLQSNKAVLNNPKRDIKPVPQTSIEWHRFGRQQGLNISIRKEKILLGVMSSGDKYAIDKYSTLFTSGGTAGYCGIILPDNLEYSIYYIQAILNSKYVEWFAILTGEIFRGGYFARGTKVLNNLPIRTIDFTNPNEKILHNDITEAQKELIRIQDLMDTNSGNRRTLTPLKRQFDAEKHTLDDLLSKLYNLGKDDIHIPLLKDYNEAN